MTCLNNLKQWGLALSTYQEAHNGVYPVGNVLPNNYPLNWQGGWWGFQARLLPYLECNDIYKLCEPGFTYNGECFDFINVQPPALKPSARIPNCDKCPDDHLINSVIQNPQGLIGDYACGSYLGVDGTAPWPTKTDGILLHSTYNDAITVSKVTDGLSHTLIMGERGVSQLLYGWPYCGAGDAMNSGDGDNLMSTQAGLSAGTDDGADDYHFWSYHPNLAKFICADGSGHVLSYDIDLPTFQGLSTRAGGEIVQLPDGGR